VLPGVLSAGLPRPPLRRHRPDAGRRLPGARSGSGSAPRSRPPGALVGPDARRRPAPPRRRDPPPRGARRMTPSPLPSLPDAPTQGRSDAGIRVAESLRPSFPASGGGWAEGLGLYWRLTGARARSQMQYKFSFALLTVMGIVNVVVDFVEVVVIFGRIP